MRSVLIIAGRELRRAVRNRWIIAVTAVLMALALALAFLGSAPAGTVGAGRLDVTVVSLASLSVFLLPLIALMLSFDAIVGEIEGGTLALLLTCPVARWQVVLGKFLGHAAVIGLATIVGFGAAAVAVAVGDGSATEGLAAFAAMTGWSIVLGAAFLAIGYLLSTAVYERGAAAALAVGVWLLFVLLFDMGLLGVLVADGGRHIGAATVNAVMLLNPTDVYRLLNLTGSAGTAALSGMAGLADEAPATSVLALALAAWVVAPLAAAMALFHRREI